MIMIFWRFLGLLKETTTIFNILNKHIQYIMI